MDNKKTDQFLWGLVTVIVTGLIGSAYCLYNHFKPEDICEEDLAEIEEIKQTIEDEFVGEITPEIANRILRKAYQMADNLWKKEKFDLEEKRRLAINNEYEYKKLCNEMFEFKNDFEKKSLDLLLRKFGITMRQFNKVIGKVNPADILSKQDKPQFDEGVRPDKNKIREAFLYFSSRLLKEKSILHQNIDNNNLGEEEQQKIIKSIMIMKIKLEDELYLKYNFNESQMFFLLHEFGLLEEPQINEIYKKMRM